MHNALEQDGNSQAVSISIRLSKVAEVVARSSPGLWHENIPAATVGSLTTCGPRQPQTRGAKVLDAEVQKLSRPLREMCLSLTTLIASGWEASCFGCFLCGPVLSCSAQVNEALDQERHTTFRLRLTHETPIRRDVIWRLLRSSLLATAVHTLQRAVAGQGLVLKPLIVSELSRVSLKTDVRDFHLEAAI